MKRHGAALDSNVYTYLVQAAADGYDPATDGDESLRHERVAALRLFLYVSDLYVPPTVRGEIEAIPDEIQESFQLLTGDVLLPELANLDEKAVEMRTSDLFKLHDGRNDCRILAESEVGGAAIFLTFDSQLQTRLGELAEIPICRPSEYWNQVALEKGSKPAVTPHPTNPLSKLDWWRW